MINQKFSELKLGFNQVSQNKVIAARLVSSPLDYREKSATIYFTLLTEIHPQNQGLKV